MATEAEMKKVAVKMIEDDDFRAAFTEDPEKAVSSMGVTLTGGQLAEVKRNLTEAAEAIRREAKAWICGPHFFVVS